MRIRFWVGLAAVFLIAIGSVTAALIVHGNESDSFHETQHDEAVRSARQAEAVAGLSVGQLAAEAAFFRAEGQLSQHEFRVIAGPLLGKGALHSTAFIERVPASRRRAFERERGKPIVEKVGARLRRARPRAEYFPVAFSLTEGGDSAPVGYDLGPDPVRGPFLRQARDRGTQVATSPVLLLTGGLGINVYRPVYRDGAPTATVAERRRALVGFSAGAFRIRDLASAAASGLAPADQVQLRVGHGSVVGDRGRLEDPARATIQIADRTWLLVIRDPNRPDIGLPLLLGGVGISLALLLGALVLVWSRNEHMQELEREARQDSLTGLKNRRSFEEELRREMARSRRLGTTGAMLMLDLDHFKRVNDTQGHPAGDDLIREIAHLLSLRVRETDVLARLGGDEFAIVLPSTGVAEAQLVAAAIVEAIREHSSQHDEGLITASIGIAMFGDDPRISFASIVSEADTAMYAAKDGGRDGIRVFDPLAIREDSPGAG
jgi:diguanylate cyclase (GGDEF)-like protein